MTFGSLFAGIGGFDLGLERAGMECAWQVEIDDYCNKVLEKHWPNVKRYRDVREVGKHNLEPVDLICGGFPCQPFSVAGKQRGDQDDRHLWPEMFRIIQEVRPRWVLGENVAGIIRLVLDEVLSDLESADYQTQTFIIPACAVDAPHRRDRVWIVAHTRCELRQGSIKRRKDGLETGREMADIFERSGKTSREDVADAEDSHGWGANREDNAGGGDSEIGRCGIGSGGVQYWLPEPDVGRVAHELSPELDGGRLVHEMDEEEESATELFITWEALREMWDKQEFTKTPSVLRGRCLPYPLHGLPYRNGPTSWHPPSKEDKALLDLWERVSSLPYEKAQYMLPHLLERIGAHQRKETMGFPPEPNIQRVAHGIKNRVDRLRCLGNAVVPQLVEVLGRAIMEVDKCKSP